MSKRIFINIVPGKTFLHKLSGKTKVGLFIICIVYTIMSFDLRLLAPLMFLSLIAIVSLKPDWKVITVLFIAIFLMNFFNIFLYWVVKPDIGSEWTGGTSTILYSFSSYYFVSLETIWYLLVRLFKMLTSFTVSMAFILSITPSELASGLHGLGVPYKICTVVSLAFRYIPDISRDYENIKVSMQARGVEMDLRKTPILKRLKQTIYILFPLIITSFDRIGNIANALDLRGYGLKKDRTYYAEVEPTLMDKLFRWSTLALFLFCLAWIVSRNIWEPATKMWFPFEV